MASQEILQNMISQLGQSQTERCAAALGVQFARVDERTTEELFRLAGKLAKRIDFYRGDVERPAGDWTPFFPDDEKKIRELLARDDGTTAPHHALFLAFLELYRLPQEVMNRITGRHLDFYYREVLRLDKRPPQADRAHLLIELKKGTPPLAITPEQLFSAGPDQTGKEVLYAPTGLSVVNHARVTSLLASFVDTTIRCGELPAAQTDGRHPFGDATLTPARIGFAVSSAALRMAGGRRTVTVAFSLARHLDIDLQDAFDIFLTGEKGWLPCTVEHQDDRNELNEQIGQQAQDKRQEQQTIRFGIPESAGKVVPHDPAVHLHRFPAGEPVALFVLKQEKGSCYRDLARADFTSMTLSVSVIGLRPESIETETGSADPKKAFLPFGPHPSPGARLAVGCPEALGKHLADLAVTVSWKGMPDLRQTYDLYGTNIGPNSFRAAVSFTDAGGRNTTKRGQALFDSIDAKPATGTFHLKGTEAGTGKGYSHKEFDAARQKTGAAPVTAGDGIVFSLECDFYQSTYRQKYIEGVTNFATNPGGGLKLPAEPYTPAIESLTIDYSTDPAQVPPAPGKNPSAQFYHVGCFGSAPAGEAKRNSLLPEYSGGGELAVGVADLSPGDSVSLLFQVAEGSGDPLAEPDVISWSVLCGDRWLDLGTSGITRDTTNELRTSGIITFAVPAGATITHTLMPPGMIWLKGRRGKGAAGADLLIEVAANAVEVKWLSTGDGASHLASALPAGKIAKAKTPLPAVKSIVQPYSSFGGREEESDAAFHTRVSERLRHKDRCISPWDIERIVLEEFPKIHRVKCIPHAQPGSYLAPGHTLVIVIPDLRNRTGVNLLQPRVDHNSRSTIQGAVEARAGLGVRVHVANPTYRAVALDFAVRFTRADFNYWAAVLQKDLVRFLSPWAFDSDREPLFGGKIAKSTLIDFVEELDYVDFVTDFRMTGGGDADLDEVAPLTPDELLVSADRHTIREVRP